MLPWLLELLCFLSQPARGAPVRLARGTVVPASGEATLEMAVSRSAAAALAAASVLQSAGVETAGGSAKAAAPASGTGDTGRLPSSGMAATGAGAAAGGWEPPDPRRLGGGGVFGTGQQMGPAEPIRMLDGGREPGGVALVRAVPLGVEPTVGLAGRTGSTPRAVAVVGLTLPPCSCASSARSVMLRASIVACVPV